jgi:hypothetical protein
MLDAQAGFLPHSGHQITTKDKRTTSLFDIWPENFGIMVSTDNHGAANLAE